MSVVVETDVGLFVVTSSDGRKIAGPFPFDKKGDAYQAKAEVAPLCVRNAKHGKGYFVANEETDTQVGGEFFKKYEDAWAEMERLNPTIKKWGTPPDGPPLQSAEQPARRGRPPKYSEVAA